jgi:hypothetical protein
MDDPENVFDIISAIQQGDADLVRQAVEMNHVTPSARDQGGTKKTVSYFESKIDPFHQSLEYWQS